MKALTLAAYIAGGFFLGFLGAGGHKLIWQVFRDEWHDLKLRREFKKKYGHKP